MTQSSSSPAAADVDALVGALALVDPLVVDVGGRGEIIWDDAVALVADEARRLRVPVLELDAALDAFRVVAEWAGEDFLQLGCLLRLRRQLGAPRLPLPHLAVADAWLTYEAGGSSGGTSALRCVSCLLYQEIKPKPKLCSHRTRRGFRG